MLPNRSAGLFLRAFWEMVWYDLSYRIFGFAAIRRSMERIPEAPAGDARSADLPAVCGAVDCMASFYWKPLLCLQRSVVLARLLRARGIQAEVLIGYRASPFFSHAWVEVGGRVVNDSPVYRRTLQILEKF